LTEIILFGGTRRAACWRSFWRKSDRGACLRRNEYGEAFAARDGPCPHRPLNGDGMEALIMAERPRAVIDATSIALEASGNIRGAL
jgi:hypothetical protein